MRTGNVIIPAVLACVFVSLPPRPAAAQETRTTQEALNWQQTKCTRYKSAWTFTLARRGTTGLSEAFMLRHEAFLASGCTAKADVCPRFPEEFALANIMVILAMNAGTASTFPPFACPK
jgi:hypothetical protein